MAQSFRDLIDAMKADYARETAGEATETERGIDTPPGLHAASSSRRAGIVALIEGGATEGERTAAQAALERHDAAAVSHNARMGRLDSEAAEYGGYE